MRGRGPRTLGRPLNSPDRKTSFWDRHADRAAAAIEADRPDDTATEALLGLALAS